MRTRNTYKEGCLIFVDTSGSMNDRDSFVQEEIKNILENNNGVVSMYSSNHLIRQYFFNNKKAFNIPFEYGGLSSIYDNFMECIRDHLRYDSDIFYDIYVFSDMMDNNSVHTKEEFCTFVNQVNQYWKIHFIQ